MIWPSRVEAAMAIAVRTRMAINNVASASHSWALKAVPIGWSEKSWSNMRQKRYARPTRGVVMQITVLEKTLP